MPELTILLVEDERDLLELLRYNLEREGYAVATAETGEDGLKLVRQSPPDLILLDLMLPAMDGLEVCRSLKASHATSDIPVVMLTAKGEETDVVRGLELGADDYITKPFSPRILLARIKAVLRRADLRDDERRVVEAGGVRVDLEKHLVTAEGEEVELTATEFKLLTLLVSRPARVFTRQQIIDALHEGFAAVTDRSVDVQVVALRRKLGPAGKRIETVRGVGYRFKD
ncbi:MAG: response regulator transcription factor [Planctomycetota bacterium]